MTTNEALQSLADLGVEIDVTASYTLKGDADDRPTEEVAFYYNKIAF